MEVLAMMARMKLLAMTEVIEVVATMVGGIYSVITMEPIETKRECRTIP